MRESCACTTQPGFTYRDQPSQRALSASTPLSTAASIALSTAASIALSTTASIALSPTASIALSTTASTALGDGRAELGTQIAC